MNGWTWSLRGYAALWIVLDVLAWRHGRVTKYLPTQTLSLVSACAAITRFPAGIVEDQQIRARVPMTFRTVRNSLRVESSLKRGVLHVFLVRSDE